MRMARHAFRFTHLQGVKASLAFCRGNCACQGTDAGWKPTFRAPDQPECLQTRQTSIGAGPVAEAGRV